MAKVSIEGRAKLKKQLRAIPPAVKSAAGRTLKQNANEFADRVRRDVPVGLTGELLLSVSVLEKKRKRGLAFTVLVGQQKIGDAVFYPTFVEFGTDKAVSKPFFFPNLRLLRRRLRSRLTRNINKAIKGLK